MSWGSDDEVYKSGRGMAGHVRTDSNRERRKIVYSGDLGEFITSSIHREYCFIPVSVTCSLDDAIPDWDVDACPSPLLLISKLLSSLRADPYRQSYQAEFRSAHNNFPPTLK